MEIKYPDKPYLPSYVNQKFKDDVMMAYENKLWFIDTYIADPQSYMLAKLIGRDQELCSFLCETNHPFIHTRANLMKLIENGAGNHNSYFIRDIPEQFRGDRNVLNLGIAKGVIHPHNFEKDVPTEVLSDPSFMKPLIMKDSAFYKHASQEIREDKAFALSVIKERGDHLIDLDFKLKNDPNMFIDCIRASAKPINLMQIPTELKGNKEVFHAVVDSHIAAQAGNAKVMTIYWWKEMEKAGHAQDFSLDAEIMNKLIALYPPNIRFASEELRNNAHFMLNALDITELSNQGLPAFAQNEINLQQCMGNQLNQVVGSNDPVTVMKNMIRQEKLDAELAPSPSIKAKVKERPLKI